MEGFQFACDTSMGMFFTNDPWTVAHLPFITQGPVEVSDGETVIVLDPLGALDEIQA